MVQPARHHPTDSAAHPLLESVGFDAGDDRWLNTVRDADAPLPCGRIGAYELIEESGRGGQGLVFRARQIETGRTIAIKRLLCGSFASAAMRRRFEREIEVLSSLSHPHIVTVFGTELVDGIPILAMEWIEGAPINRWAAEAQPRRPLRELVEMFLKVCGAVHHAHQHGVIHRDLKPSNILIDAAGQPRVLDFGLAKLALGDPVLDAAGTATAQFVGTLRYASPEQIAGQSDALDVRSDVYSLGVILFELITGRFPYEVGDDPSRAPTMMEAAAPPCLDAPTEGVDAALAAVVLTAVARRPEQRYQSVETFAADLRRWIEGEPVLAKPATGWESAKALIRRHRTAASLIAASLAVIATVAVVATLFAARIARERDVAFTAQREEAAAKAAARDEAEKARAVSEFLQAMLVQADPRSGKARDVTLREVLVQASQHIMAAPDMPAEVQAATHRVLGITYHSRGEHDDAERHLRRALEASRALHAGDHPDVAESLHELGHLMTSRGRYDASEPMLREALRMRIATLGEDHLDVATSLNHLAKIVHLRGRYDEAEPLWRRSLDIRRRRLGETSADVAGSMCNLAVTRLAQGHPREAEALLRQTLDLARAALGSEHPDIGFTLHNLARARQELGDLPGAQALYEEALRIKRVTLKEDHPAVGFTLHAIADLHVRLGDDARAEVLYLQVLPIYRRAMDPDHPRTIALLEALVELYQRRGEPDRACEFEAALDEARAHAAKAPSVAVP